MQDCHSFLSPRNLAWKMIWEMIYMPNYFSCMAVKLYNNCATFIMSFTAQTKARDTECRLYFQARKECRNIASDLQTKEAYISDQQKKIRELEAELMDFLHAYEVNGD